MVAAVGTPLIGCIDPALKIPDYVRSVCSTVISDAGASVAAVADIRPVGSDALAAAVGPVGGSAARLLDAWSAVVTAR